jgi:hypothetical protein
MLTLDEVQERARKAGTPIADRTFWKYVRLGLLPNGETVPGTGHKRFFPDDLPDRIVQLNWLNKDVGIPLPVLHKSLLYLREGEHWESPVMRREPSPLDLIVSWAGVMANMHIVHKPGLDLEDVKALFGRLKTMVEKLGVCEPSVSSPLQEHQHVDSPQKRKTDE